tara:strand:+ start:335 stop:490 length:156 start_codon:yes stop_codon:yes gene_type:complete
MSEYKDKAEFWADRYEAYWDLPEFQDDADICLIFLRRNWREHLKRKVEHFK